MNLPRCKLALPLAPQNACSYSRVSLRYTGSAGSIDARASAFSLSAGEVTDQGLRRDVCEISSCTEITAICGTSDSFWLEVVRLSDGVCSEDVSGFDPACWSSFNGSPPLSGRRSSRPRGLADLSSKRTLFLPRQQQNSNRSKCLRKLVLMK